MLLGALSVRQAVLARGETEVGVEYTIKGGAAGYQQRALHWTLDILTAHGLDRPRSSNNTIRLDSTPCAFKECSSIPGLLSAVAAKVESTASASTQPTPPSGRELKGLCSTWPCPWSSPDSAGSVGWD